MTVTSGEDTGHPENPHSNGPTKSSHPLLAGPSGARSSTYYSQTQPDPPEFSQHIASTVGSPTRNTTNFGPPILISLPPYSTLNLQGGGDFYIIYSPRNRFSYYPTPTNSSTLPTESVPITVTQWLPFAAITQYAKRSSPKEVPKAPHPNTPHGTSPIPTQVNTKPTHNTPIS